MPESNRTAEVKEPEPSRDDEARRVIEEYASDLRKIIRKLYRKSH